MKPPFELDKNGNPTPEACRFVAQVFRDAVEKYPEAKLEMDQYDVNIHHECGTAHCHGGWYAVMRCELSTNLMYFHGKTQLAKDLGFQSGFDLRHWADNNAIIWGNRLGPLMFGDSRAFTPKGNTQAYNLLDIADHWDEVAERIEKN